MPADAAPTTWILSDGAAGNRRPAQALATALGLSVRELVLQTAVPWRWLAPRWLPGSATAFGAEFAEALESGAPGLAIGCGRQAALATRWLRARHGVRAVQILDPRIDPAAFDLVLAPTHDGLSGANVLGFCGGLHAIDGPALARARIAHAELSRLPGPRTLLLLGGPSRHFRLDRRLWAQTVEILRHWQARDGGSLLVSSSRRSPPWLCEAAARDLGDLPGCQWHGGAEADNPYLGFLAWADRIVVTPDSANMLAEACATAAPVYCPGSARLRGRLSSLYRDLLERGRVRPFKLDAGTWNVDPLRETGRLAGEVRARLGLR